MMNTYVKFLSLIASEFDRYVMEHEAFADAIPPNALIIFRVRGEDGFNAWHERVSLHHREAGQPMIYAHIRKWRAHSSIEEIALAKAA
jgi:hypothetical protein